MRRDLRLFIASRWRSQAPTEILVCTQHGGRKRRRGRYAAKSGKARTNSVAGLWRVGAAAQFAAALSGCCAVPIERRLSFAACMLPIAWQTQVLHASPGRQPGIARAHFCCSTGLGKMPLHSSEWNGFRGGSIRTASSADRTTFATGTRRVRSRFGTGRQLCVPLHKSTAGSSRIQCFRLRLLSRL